MSDEIFDMVRRHLVEVLAGEVEPHQVKLESSLRDDLGLTSLEAVSLVIAVEEELSIALSDEEMGSFRTVDDVVRLLESKSLEE